MNFKAVLDSLDEAARRIERERCAKIADAYADACDRGSPVSSMAEDRWGAVAARAIAAAIRAEAIDSSTGEKKS